MEDKIRVGTSEDVMTVDVITGNEDEPLASIVGRMGAKDISQVPIVDEKNRVRGMVDYHVLVKHRRHQGGTKAKHVMFVPPDVEPSTPLVEVADHLIQHELRALPVVEKGRLVGIVSRTDLVNFASRIAGVRTVPVAEIMTPEPKTVSPDDDIAAALAVIKRLDERNLPVVEDDLLVGVVGVKDISSALIRPTERSPILSKGKESKMSPQIKGLMNPPITVAEGANLGTVMDRMIESDVSMLPVMRKETLVGVITHYDLVEFVARYREREEVLVQITGIEAEPEIYDAMYEIIGRLIERISSFSRPETIITHIGEHGNPSEEGHGFYEVRVRLNAERTLFTAFRSGWNLLVALDECLEAIETQVRKDHDKREADNHRPRR